MASETVIIVVGGDYLALEICREILKTAGHAVVMMWKHTDERTARLFTHETDRLAEEFGDAFTFLNEDPANRSRCSMPDCARSKKRRTKNFASSPSPRTTG